MIWLWVGFLTFVVAMLALDLGVIHRKAHVVSLKESLGWSAVWIGMALAFSPVVYLLYSSHLAGFGNYNPALVSQSPSLYPDSPLEAMTMYLAGYVTEKSLSVDNIFVIALIFAYFRIPGMYQHRVLFWGILGAIVLRGIFIGVGAALIANFHWVIYIFGVILLITAIKLLFSGEPEPGESWLTRFIYRRFPVTDRIHGQQFIIPRSELMAGEEVEEHGEKHAAAEGERDFRRRFDPGDFRHHRRPVHRLHEQHFRHPGAAGALLRAGGGDPQVPLPADSAGADPRIHCHQDARQRGHSRNRVAAGGDAVRDARGGYPRHCRRHCGIPPVPRGG
jgi:TerC family integral membrane protein